MCFPVKSQHFFFFQIKIIFLKLVGLLIHPTNMVEAEATMTTSADKVNTWVSRATSGETAVRVFILLQTFSFFC